MTTKQVDANVVFTLDSLKEKYPDVLLVGDIVRGLDAETFTSLDVVDIVHSNPGILIDLMLIAKSRTLNIRNNGRLPNGIQSQAGVDIIFANMGNISEDEPDESYLKENDYKRFNIEPPSPTNNYYIASGARNLVPDMAESVLRYSYYQQHYRIHITKRDPFDYAHRLTKTYESFNADKCFLYQDRMDAFESDHINQLKSREIVYPEGLKRDSAVMLKENELVKYGWSVTKEAKPGVTIGFTKKVILAA